jgi:hypothetical protein
LIDVSHAGREKAMYINKDALSSLQIFEDESHASTHSTATKEGLSLFGISVCLNIRFKFDSRTVALSVGVMNLTHTPVG